MERERLPDRAHLELIPESVAVDVEDPAQLGDLLGRRGTGDARAGESDVSVAHGPLAHLGQPARMSHDELDPAAGLRTPEAHLAVDHLSPREAPRPLRVRQERLPDVPDRGLLAVVEVVDRR